jgi:dephospho-CoA kinase
VLRVGLTGGIACGKSHVLAAMREAGCLTLDLDSVARGIMTSGSAAQKAVLDEFGPSIRAYDGGVDRPRLAAIVFEDEAARLRLNDIVHPWIRDEEERFIAAANPTADTIVVIDGALLIEGGGHLRYDRIVVVGCDRQEQLARIMKRDGLDDAQAIQRINSQMTLAEKRRFADYEISTSGTHAETDRQIAQLLVRLRSALEKRKREPKLPLRRAVACLARTPQAGPHGIDPAWILDEVISSGALNMQHLLKRVEARYTGPWYRFAYERESTKIGPETLTPALTIWLLNRRFADRTRVIAAAASLARLTHTDADAIAGACLLGEALYEVAVSRTLAKRKRWECWRNVADRWGAGRPSAEIVNAIEMASAALAGSAHAAVAREEGQYSLCASLVALGSDHSAATFNPTWSARLARIGYRDEG